MYAKTNVQFIHEYLELSQSYLEKEEENSATFLSAVYLSQERASFLLYFYKLAQYVALTRLMSRRHCTFTLRSFRTKEKKIIECTFPVEPCRLSLKSCSQISSLLIIYM